MKDNQLDFLTDVYQQYITSNNLPNMSADDLLYAHMYAEVNLAIAQQTWVETFISIWEDLS